MQITPNTTIRDYTILSKLGEGGMGEVWKAVDTVLDRTVALKVLFPEFMRDTALVERFKQEAKMQAQLLHSGIVTLFTFFFEQGTFFMVLEYAEGSTIKQMIQGRGRFSEQEATGIMQQLLDAVGYAHTLGIVHRDIKPSNIIIGPDGRAKILDFGIAKVLGDKGMTRTGAKMGTVFYMSPEQIRAQKDIDQRTDIYSLGITLYEMLTGKVPFNTSTESDFEIMQEIMSGWIQLVNSIPGVSEGMLSVIKRLTHLDREQRFSTCYQANEALGGGIVATQTAKPIEKKNPASTLGAPAIIKPVLSISELFPDSDFVFVESGSFMMGSPSKDGLWNKLTDNTPSNEKPQHKVTLDSFYLAKYQVTQKQWEAVMGENPSHFKGENLPVEKVSWDDVQKFIEIINVITIGKYRLPTEAEWEYAARGGKKSEGYVYSGSNTIDEVAWYGGNSGSKTHPAGTKKPNELELYDMSGNVWEWCNDWYNQDYYKNSSSENPKGPSTGTTRVLRGGSWLSSDLNCLVANRGDFDPNDMLSSLGFRLVQDRKPLT